MRSFVTRLVHAARAAHCILRGGSVAYRVRFERDGLAADDPCLVVDCYAEVAVVPVRIGCVSEPEAEEPAAAKVWS